MNANQLGLLIQYIDQKIDEKIDENNGNTSITNASSEIYCELLSTTHEEE